MNLQITFVRVTNNSYFCTHKSKTDILTMKLKVFVLAALLATGTASSMTLKNNRTNGDVMSKEADGTYVVNTTTLAKDVKGFKGNTPLYIYIKGGKVVKVAALNNQETPNFFNKVRQGLLDKWNGMKASKASTANVDGVTGATFSSKAVKENVKRGVKYYLNHK